jgi:predicted Zn-dependent protease
MDDGWSSDETKDPDPKLATEAFRWGAAIREVLGKQTDHRMSQRKLRKKVVKMYMNFHMKENSPETKVELGLKFDKKLKKKGFTVMGDTVYLIQ